MKKKGNLLFKETLWKYYFPSASHVFFTQVRTSTIFKYPNKLLKSEFIIKMVLINRFNMFQYFFAF